MPPRQTVVLLGVCIVSLLLLSTRMPLDCRPHTTPLPVHTNPETTMHIATAVCGSLPDQALAMLKSVIFFRTGPISVHFVVDEDARASLREQLGLWKLPLFHATFHLIDPYKDLFEEAALLSAKVKGNPHAQCAFSKLVMEQILVDQEMVVFLDADIIVLEDIRRLWNEGHAMPSSSMFAMTQEQSGWYADKQESYKWPAWKDIGFNSGVMVMNLTAMRYRAWLPTWRRVMTGLVRQHDWIIQLADQDVLNAVIASHPSIVHELPCGWNVQLNGDRECHDTLKVIHGNNNRFVGDDEPLADTMRQELRRFYASFRALDQRWLRSHR